MGETDDQLNVKVKGGILLDLDKKDIRLWQKQTVSVMPSGLEQLLTFDELVDLVEDLTTLRGE
ncbi:MAG: hypothetical protein O7J95_12305 [Planctomycetota bacterium]|nr:hypothetical protein [Planctomycetota bacterium]